MQYLLASFCISLLAILLLLKTCLINIALDRPNQRSLHSNIISRTGGLAIMMGILAVWGWMAAGWLWFALPLLLVAVSLADDIRELSVRWRFLAQILVCSIFVWFALPELALWVMILVVLAMVWMVNLYNFMDGSDGLAGGMALFGFGGYGVAAFLSNDMNFALMSGCIVAAALAFLVFNFHPARIFMGDAGSVPLGFLAGAMGLYGWEHGLWPTWFPILVFSPFIVDASVTLLRRLLRGEKVWQAHRSHYYQRLVQMGWGHRKTAIAEYILMLVVGLSGILILNQSFHVVFLVLVLWVLIYIVLMWNIDKRWSQIMELRQCF